MIARVCVFVGSCVGVYGCVWRSGWQKDHVFSWNRLLMIELYAVAS